jgi:hypothetical protein
MGEDTMGEDMGVVLEKAAIGGGGQSRKEPGLAIA